MAAQKGIAFGFDLIRGLLTVELGLICVLSVPDSATMAPESVLSQSAWIVPEEAVLQANAMAAGIKRKGRDSPIRLQ